MLVDSTAIHQALNDVALYCHKQEILSPIECIRQIRKALNDIEADTACRNAQFKYATALEGLGNK